MKRIVLLGASGSIGLQTIDVIRQHPDEFSLVAFGVGRQVDKAREILKEFPVSLVSVSLEEDARDLEKEYPHLKVYCGDEGLLELASRSDYDILVNALVGFAGFAPTMAAIHAHHDITLANKETMVVGGILINRAVREAGISLTPIDSEHSAILQCLQGNRRQDVRRLIITCSGGAFRRRTRQELANVTPEEAMEHPTWSMGPKITIDSATLMNKGFEVTEAHWLFDLPYEKIDVVMHWESVVHSMVEYQDHSIIAQMSAPDMRLPIQYALTCPNRLPLAQEHPLDLTKIGTLHFEKPDLERFPLLGLAYEAGKRGGNLDAVMNAANEVANLAFREHQISFLEIEHIVTEAVHQASFAEVESVADLIAADTWGRQFAEAMVEGVSNH